MARHLLLRLEGPLMAFGTTAIDHRRPVQPWPATSMLTGLLANALGWDRAEGARLERLQARLRWAARIERPGEHLYDFQTAQLSKQEVGWTTRGVVEERGGGDKSYNSPHLRDRDYRADASVLVALRLEPADAAPTLDELAAALERPARPLFLGRKGCPPAARLAAGWADGENTAAALETIAAQQQASWAQPALYSNEAGAIAHPDRVHQASDERRFSTDVHAGTRPIFERCAR
ncbi:type I-E CRISPR-associated protein Cas5/CasD [Rubrivivax gelatinosus]|uniref:type I-E CRISPR-associated protein Cas5/CasD n=1 Tax=Rubrivivax gelatinosus TaxID=28068 RepID=UPI0005C25D97|nr:type I-E CRISPR-associated protein Cas5/CasD [Rubrivivax gelatinosus]MBG6080652.1 CRISPR system Cascade subunit CasD [Rubrivivax gelatinosus]